MITVSIDPGIRGCGAAVWTGLRDAATLYWAGYVRNPCLKGNRSIPCVQMAGAIKDALTSRLSCDADTVIVEWPEMYTAAHQKGDQNDLPPLVGVDMALAGMFCNAEHFDYLPKEWKGQLPKGEAFNQRVRERLSEAEFNAATWPSFHLQHNVWDAIGIGLHHFGRFARRRVFSAGGDQ